MNPLPPNADELVSAYLDGEAAPDEIAIVESNPELLQRVEDLRALTVPFQEPATPPPGLMEDQLAGALGLFDELVTAGDFPAAQDPAAQNPATPSAVPTTTATTTDDSVVSFESARQRRRDRQPRRFNTGVIAAAAAALLLFVGLAALSFGRAGSDDVADGGSFDAAVESTQALDGDDALADDGDFDSGSDTAEDAPSVAQAERAEAPAADAELFAADDAEEGEDPEADSDAIAGSMALEAAEEPTMDEAMDDAMDDAMDSAADADEAADGENAAVPAEPRIAGAPGIDPFLGEFADIDALAGGLADLDPGDIEMRYAVAEDQLGTDCQSQIPDLADAIGPTLIGQAFLDRAPDSPVLVEIHALTSPETDPGGDGSTILVVDVLDCSLVATLP